MDTQDEKDKMNQEAAKAQEEIKKTDDEDKETSYKVDSKDEE